MRHATLEDNLREMERTREQYWRRVDSLCDRGERQRFGEVRV